MSDNKDGVTTKHPGRPRGYKLSEETREKIRRRRIGTVQSKKTRDKISSSLLTYFKKKDLLTNGLKQEYFEASREAVDWIEDNKDIIDDTKDIMTERRLLYLNQVEICFGFDINNFGHNANPEFILLLKEVLQKEKDIEGLQKLYSLI
jgi:hypothetical protein